MKRNFAFWIHYLMRLKPANSVFLLSVCCSLLAVLDLHAQEGKPQIEMEIMKSDPDPVSTSESDLRTNSKSVSPSTSKEITRDSLQIKPVKPVKSSEKTQEKEEDPLSFNFLYYIIEKFKLSDVID